MKLKSSPKSATKKMITKNLPSMTYQMARLKVNEKILYIKTWTQNAKTLSLEDMFLNYPFGGFEGFQFHIEKLIQDQEEKGQIKQKELKIYQRLKQQQNPQKQEGKNQYSSSLYQQQLQKQSSKQHNKKSQNDKIIGNIIHDDNGYHFVQHVDYIDKQLQNNMRNRKAGCVTQDNKFIVRQKQPQSKVCLFNGISISIFNNGSIYQGNYHDGHFCGQSLEINQEGDLYLGYFKDGVKKGVGIFYSFDAYEYYKGKWQGDLPHGEGIYVTEESQYQGGFCNGLKNGFGIEKFLNSGDYYTGTYIKHFVGEYCNGVCQGYGEYYWVDGSTYKGDFSHGFRHGYGIWNDTNQAYYGQYRMDKKQGYGIYTWKSKKVYKGQFKQDFRQGYGEIYNIGGIQNKLIYKGGWQRGIKKSFLKITQQVIYGLHSFLKQQKDFLQKIPLRKQRFGHKQCVPGGCCRKHH